MPIRCLFPLPFCPCFFLLFRPSISLTAVVSPPLHIRLTFHHCSFIHPGNRNRLQQCWYYDRVRALRWSLGLNQECCVSRPAATSSIHGLPLRIRTAGKNRITGLKRFPPAVAEALEAALNDDMFGYIILNSGSCLSAFLPGLHSGASPPNANVVFNIFHVVFNCCLFTVAGKRNICVSKKFPAGHV